MNRRNAGLALLSFAALAGAGRPFAQPPRKVHRIGYLSTPTRESVENALNAFLRGLRELGWTDGQNLAIEYRWADGDVERLPALAADLVQRNVDLIVAPAGSAALAAKAATKTIPIVMIFPVDPVELGLVTSFAHPGGNVTGTTYSTGPGFTGKQLAILKDVAPHASRIAILRNPVDRSIDLKAPEVEDSLRALRLRMQPVDARGAEDLPGAFAAIARERADALLVGGSSTFLAHRAKVIAMVNYARLPAMYSFREYVEAGGLMAYAVNMSNFIGTAAGYVDRILRGAKPSDLPVQQPSLYELTVNRATAKAQGIEFPPSVVSQIVDYL